MCSIGHQQDMETPRRRHTDGTYTAMVRKMPRAELAENKARKTAELRAEIEAQQAERLMAEYGLDAGFEPMPADMEQLPLLTGDDTTDKETRRELRSQNWRMRGDFE